MKIAIDYNDTITNWPNELRHLAQAVKFTGGEVYIVSACYAKNKRLTEDGIRHAGIPNDGVRIVPFVDYTLTPKLKLPVFQELGVEMIFDDNPEVVHLAIAHGIMGVLVQGQSLRSIL